MKKIEGFDYFLDDKGNVFKQTKNGFKKVSQDFYSYKLHKDGQTFKYNKCVLFTKVFYGKMESGYGILVQDGDTKNVCLNNLSYIKYEELGIRINGFSDYIITKNGEVYTTKNDRVYKMKTYIAKNGYENIKLCKNNKTYIKQIHRLVAEHYLINPSNKQEVDHIDCNKLNNKSSNLRWCTRQENISYSLINKSPVKNFIECSLLKVDELIDNFTSITECCRYARDNFECSYTSLMKYRKHKNFTIIFKETSND
ncbi:MAG: HNH endonuclease signature motif containing protein [Clostridia bacterium]